MMLCYRLLQRLLASVVVFSFVMLAASGLHAQNYQEVAKAKEELKPSLEEARKLIIEQIFANDLQHRHEQVLVFANVKTDDELKQKLAEVDFYELFFFFDEVSFEKNQPQGSGWVREELDSDAYPTPQKFWHYQPPAAEFWKEVNQAINSPLSRLAGDDLRLVTVDDRTIRGRYWENDGDTLTLELAEGVYAKIPLEKLDERSKEIVTLTTRSNNVLVGAVSDAKEKLSQLQAELAEHHERFPKSAGDKPADADPPQVDADTDAPAAETEK